MHDKELQNPSLCSPVSSSGAPCGLSANNSGLALIVVLSTISVQFHVGTRRPSLSSVAQLLKQLV